MVFLDLLKARLFTLADRPGIETAIVEMTTGGRRDRTGHFAF